MRNIDPDRCVAEVLTSGTSASYYQCSRKRGYGPDGKYCKQHALEHTDGAITVWRAYCSSAEVIPIVANKVTEKSVWIHGRRQARISDYYCYFDSAQEAYDFLIQEHEKAIRLSAFRTERLQKDLDMLLEAKRKCVSSGNFKGESK